MSHEDLTHQMPADPRALRLLCALDLMEFGIALMRQNIARRRAGLSAEALDAELQAWINGPSPTGSGRKAP